MPRVTIVPGVLWCVAVIGVVALIVAVVQRAQPGQGGQEMEAAAAQAASVFRVDGVTYTAQDGGQVVARLKASRIELAKGKLGMVYVSPLKEASLTNVELELHERDGARASGNLLDLFREALPPAVTHDLGVITRIRVHGLTVKLVRTGHVTSLITAQQAVIDPKTKMAELTGRVVVATADGRSVTTHASTWNQSAGVFVVDGSFLYQGMGRAVQGNRARFDPELRGLPL